MAAIESEAAEGSNSANSALKRTETGQKKDWESLPEHVDTRRGVVLDSLSTYIVNTNSCSSCKDKTKFNLSSTNISLNQYRTELESHADNCTVGNNVVITHVHDINGMPKRLNVLAYDPALGCVKDINVVNADVAYDCLHSGEVLILKINLDIHIPTISNNLLCVM